MMKRIFFFLSVLLLGTQCQQKTTPPPVEIPTDDQVTFTFMFGSCGHQDKPQPLLNWVSDQHPDAFIFLGDNIYGDTRIMDTLRAKYQRLGNKEEFQKLKNSTAIYAVWDDHDYGENDAGRHYPFKQQSADLFFDFWEVPLDSDRRKGEGIYGVEYIEKEGRTIQLLLLDTRYFRDDLTHRTASDTAFKNDYVPHSAPDSTLLGEQQWQWLEQQLRHPADFRIVASSIQFSHEYNGWEGWNNVPLEKQRFIDLIKKTRADHLMFISGDVHWGELSRQDVEEGYPIYDLTSSGITQEWYEIESNKRRVGSAIGQNNVGQIVLTFSDREATANLKLYDGGEAPVLKHKIDLSEIEFPASPNGK